MYKATLKKIASFLGLFSSVSAKISFKSLLRGEEKMFAFSDVCSLFCCKSSALRCKQTVQGCQRALWDVVTRGFMPTFSAGNFVVLENYTVELQLSELCLLLHPSKQ